MVDFDLEIRSIRPDTAEYQSALVLRQKILREPLGLNIADEDLAAERQDVHLAAFHGERLVGCLLLHQPSSAVYRMRQVAVDVDQQGAGVGRALVLASEARARADGVNTIELNARETAVRFYLRLGYEIVGEGFGLVGLPHRKMRKHL